MKTKEKWEVLKFSQIFNVVMTPVTEADIRAMYGNDRKSVPHIIALIEIGNPKQRIPM